jgi:hypothetical protein
MNNFLEKTISTIFENRFDIIFNLFLVHKKLRPAYFFNANEFKLELELLDVLNKNDFIIDVLQNIFPNMFKIIKRNCSFLNYTNFYIFHIDSNLNNIFRNISDDSIDEKTIGYLLNYDHPGITNIEELRSGIHYIIQKYDERLGWQKIGTLYSEIIPFNYNKIIDKSEIFTQALQEDNKIFRIIFDIKDLIYKTFSHYFWCKKWDKMEQSLSILIQSNYFRDDIIKIFRETSIDDNLFKNKDYFLSLLLEYKKIQNFN